MHTEKIPTGSRILDRMLEGGYEKDVITTIYGPAGSGKTILALLATITMARIGKKVIYIDTENNFSLERLKQIALDYKKILNNIVFIRPATFKEQEEAFNKLKAIINDKVGLIVIDTIAMLYRLELGKVDNAYDVNRVLGLQLSDLSEIARKRKIPVLLMNQIYANLHGEGVKIVGGDLVKYSSKCLIELKSTPKERIAALIKHRSLPERTIKFKIVEKGILGTKS